MKIENGENGYLIRNKCKITNRFNNFFINAVLNLGIEVDQHYICNNSNILDPVEKAIMKHQKHSSVSIIEKWYLSHLSLQMISQKKLKDLT